MKPELAVAALVDAVDVVAEVVAADVVDVVEEAVAEPAHQVDMVVLVQLQVDRMMSCEVRLSE